MKAVVDEALSKYGRLDVMFANAGIAGTNRDFRDLESDEVLKVLRTNVVRCVQAHFIWSIYRRGHLQNQGAADDNHITASSSQRSTPHKL